QPRGGDWIDQREALVQGVLPDRAEFLDNLAAEIPVSLWAFEKTPQQRFEIQRRAADEQNFLARRTQLGDFGVCRREVARHAEFFAGIDEIQEVVRDAAALVGRWLGGADVHPAVERHRVERDNL